MGWQMSTYLRNACINHTLRNTAFAAPATNYLALLTSIPDAANAGTEVAGGGYVRKALTWGAPVSGVIMTSAGPSWAPLHTTTDQAIVGAKIMDAAAGGNPLLYVTFDGSFTVPAGKTIAFPANFASITRSSVSAFTLFTIGKWLDLVLRGTAWAPPAAVYLAAYTTLCNELGAGTEVAAGSYARPALVMGAPSGYGDTTNTALTSFAPLQNLAAQNVLGVAVLDAAAAGNMLLFGTARPDSTAVAVPAANDYAYNAASILTKIR